MKIGQQISKMLKIKFKIRILSSRNFLYLVLIEITLYMHTVHMQDFQVILKNFFKLATPLHG